jgi:hypothetical protein
MNEVKIRYLVEKGRLRPKIKDIPKIRSILESAETNAKVTQKTIPLDEQTATIVFKEIYDALRQLGDSKWLLQGYDPQDHNASMEILIEENPVEFKHIDRFREIRNNANYRGYKVRLDEAKDILSFWNEHAAKLLEELKKETS